MREQRLIDANLLLKEAEESLCENPHTGVMAQAMHTHEHRHFMCMILHQPTIDPETLPIVQQLWAELERVKAERDAAVRDLEKAMSLEWEKGEGDVIEFLCSVCATKECGGICNPKWKGAWEETNNE